MNWSRTILDGIAMSALFNAVVLVGFTLWPQEYSVMFPKEIKETAAPYVNKTAVKDEVVPVQRFEILIFDSLLIIESEKTAPVGLHNNFCLYPFT